MWAYDANGNWSTSDQAEIADFINTHKIRYGSYYYQDREKSFKERHPGKKAPEYYMSYGNKYLNKFKSVRKTLSDEGKQWLDDALLNLQYEMEAGIAKNPNIELDNEKFQDFAFDTHVKAYEDAGILDLEVLDKVKIMLTVDAIDLFSTRGVKQAAAVGKDQLKLYNDNKLFAFVQFSGAVKDKREINRLITNYAKQQKVPVKEIVRFINKYIFGLK
ncbi:hypothetical protein [Pedobacter sp. ASV28]|uniref:hypothetical protein n=1 Tax=Pedobacter sp. ASV28 TaxID=2795123 RepID=UPI0018EB911A|nr:hypothetical protein [Pedobacter sp. ASV28]